VDVLHAKVGTIHHQDSSSQEGNFSTLSLEAIEPYMTCYGYRNPFMTTRPQVIRSGALLIPQNQGEGVSHRGRRGRCGE
jgi:hypothetical protein